MGTGDLGFQVGPDRMRDDPVMELVIRRLFSMPAFKRLLIRGDRFVGAEVRGDAIIIFVVVRLVVVLHDLGDNRPDCLTRRLLRCGDVGLKPR